MKKTKANNGDSNNALESQIPAPEPNKTPAPKTMAQFYSHAWATLFNKLSKEEQDYLTANLNKPAKVVRGTPQPDPIISKFIKNVAEVGEEMFDKATKPIAAKS